MTDSPFNDALKKNMFQAAAEILYNETDEKLINSYVNSFTNIRLFSSDRILEERNFGLYILVFVILIKCNDVSLVSAFSRLNVLFNKRLFYFILTLELHKNPEMKIPPSLDMQKEFKQYFKDNKKGSIVKYIFKDVIETYLSNKKNIQVMTPIQKDYNMLTNEQMQIVDDFCKEIHAQTQQMMSQSPFNPTIYFDKINEQLQNFVQKLKLPITNYDRHKFALAVYQTITSLATTIETIYDEIKSQFINRLNSKSIDDIKQVQNDIVKSVLSSNQQTPLSKLALLFQLYVLIQNNQKVLTTNPSAASNFLIWCNNPKSELYSINKEMYYKLCIETPEREANIQKEGSVFHQLNQKISISISEFSYYFYVKLFESINHCSSDSEAEEFLNDSDSYKDVLLSHIQQISNKHFLFSNIKTYIQPTTFPFPCINTYTQEAYKYLVFYKSDMLTDDADTIHCCACGKKYAYFCPNCKTRYCEPHTPPDKKCLFCSTPLNQKPQKAK